MVSFEEKMTAEDLASAKEQLVVGFELPNDPEQLNESYNELFEGIDSTTLEEFKRVFESMPEDVKIEMQKGNIEPVTNYATEVLKWGKKKVAQLVVGILITVAAAPAFAAGKNMDNMVIPEGGIGAMMEVPKGGVGEQMTLKRFSGVEQMEQDMKDHKKIQKSIHGTDIAQDDVEDDRGNVRATGRIVIGDHRS